MLLAYYAGYAFCFICCSYILIINCWVVGKDNLIFIIGSQMEHKLTGALCDENTSNLGWINGLFSSVLLFTLSLRVKKKKPKQVVSCIDQCASLLKLHLLQMTHLISHEAFQDYIKQCEKIQALFSTPW